VRFSEWQRHNIKSYRLKRTFIDLLDESRTSEFLSFNETLWFSVTHTWLVNTNGINLGNLFSPIDSNVFKFNKVDGRVDIKEVHNVDVGREQVLRKFSRTTFDGETMHKPPYVVANIENLVDG
jgi:hypothetical protein